MPNISITDLIPCKTGQVFIGQTFSRLTVVGTGRNVRRSYFAICECMCGSTGIIVEIGSLKNGSTKSCKCLRDSQLITHGLSGNPVFHRWQGMMSRCYSSKHPSFSAYRARGILVCEKWHDPSNFVTDMSEGFSVELELDRIDNNCGYEPSNCRWATNKENTNNRAITKYIEFDGESLHLSDWSIRLKISHKLLEKRIFERNWTVERAFTTPTMTRSETAKVANAARNSARSR